MGKQQGAYSKTQKDVDSSMMIWRWQGVCLGRTAEGSTMTMDDVDLLQGWPQERETL